MPFKIIPYVSEKLEPRERRKLAQSYTQAESMPPAWTALSESPLVHYRLLPAYQKNYGSYLPLGLNGTILLAPGHTI